MELKSLAYKRHNHVFNSLDIVQSHWYIFLNWIRTNNKKLDYIQKTYTHTIHMPPTAKQNTYKHIHIFSHPLCIQNTNTRFFSDLFDFTVIQKKSKLYTELLMTLSQVIALLLYIFTYGFAIPNISLLAFWLKHYRLVVLWLRCLPRERKVAVRFLVGSYLRL